MKRHVKTAIRWGLSLAVLPIAALLLALTPIWKVRLWILSDDTMRIILDPDGWMRFTHISGRPARTTLIMVRGNPCNSYLITMFERHFLLVNNDTFCRLAHACRPMLERIGMVFSPPSDKNWFYYTFDFAPPFLKLTSREETKGLEALEAMGVGEKDWFVCFQARDPAFRVTARPQSDASAGGTRNRDCSIENYLPSAEEITRRGGFALRMNSVSVNPLTTANPRIIDYSSRFRTEFMDIYLMAKTRFFLGNTSGILCLANAFDRPCALANYITLGDLPMRRSTISIPKLYRWRDTQELVTFPELYELKQFHINNNSKDEFYQFTTDNVFEALGIDVIENEPQDILDLTVEMFDQLDGKPADPLGLELRAEYWRRFLSHFDSDFYAANGSGLIGTRFITRWQGLMDADQAKIEHARQIWTTFYTEKAPTLWANS